MFHAGNNLKTHFESHTGESAVKCRCCAKVFSCWRLTWSVHTEERLSACELCAKAFSSGNNLQIHMKAQAGGRPYQCRHWRYCEKYFTKTTALKTQELFHSGEKYKGGEKPMCIYVSSETSTQALWVCFRWKPLFLAPFCHTLEHCVTLRSKGTNHWQKHFLCEICGKVSTPASNLRKHMVINEETLNWTQLVSIAAPVWSKRLSWKVMRCCTLEKVKYHIFGKYFHTASLIHHNFSNELLCSFQRL